MRVDSDLVVYELERRGGLAPARDVERAIAKRIGGYRAGGAVGLAVIGGRVDRVELLDGTDGLRLAYEAAER